MTAPSSSRPFAEGGDSSCSSINFVHPEEVVVREATNNAVEGPLPPPHRRAVSKEFHRTLHHALPALIFPLRIALEAK